MTYNAEMDYTQHLLYIFLMYDYQIHPSICYFLKQENDTKICSKQFALRLIFAMQSHMQDIHR